MTSGNAPAITPSEILQRLWVTLAAPIATEVGAIVALMVTAVAGMVAGRADGSVLESERGGRPAPAMLLGERLGPTPLVRRPVNQVHLVSGLPW